jgi:signal transduction histidine kinase
MTAPDHTDTEIWLLSLPPTARQTRWAIVVAACQVLALAVVGPFARHQFAPVNSFIPTFAGVIFVTDLITCILLFSQFSIYRSGALLLLACGYLFTAMMIIPYALTFPGAFSPTGLLGAGQQTTAWLYWFWHFPFPIALLVYGLIKEEKPAPRVGGVSSVTVIGRSIALGIAFAFALILLVTVGDAHMPKLFDGVAITPLASVLAAITTLAGASALATLWLRRRSLLDQWLMIVALAVILEMGLTVIFAGPRFTLGFYFARVFSLLASTIVLAVLLVETARLYARVARSNMLLRAERVNKLMNAEAVAASIAHEVKQPLTAITLNSATAQIFLAKTPPEVEEAKAALRDLVSGVQSANQTLESIRAVFGRSAGEDGHVDVNATALEALQLFRLTLQERNIATRTELEPELPPVRGHKMQLQEVISNLVKNAIEALENVTGDRRMLAVRTRRESDGAIAVEVEDSGPGIDKESGKKIFDAFITTKPNGSGLGLAICQRIIERHGGHISVSASDPQGAIFRVVLPAASLSS